MHIIQKYELYNGKQLFHNALCSSDNPTLQNLDTSLISLLQGVDECGKVNNFIYSEDSEVKCIEDEMERTDTTHHEMSYYDGLADNVAENAAQVSENQQITPSTVENSTVDTPSVD